MRDAATTSGSRPGGGWNFVHRPPACDEQRSSLRHVSWIGWHERRFPGRQAADIAARVAVRVRWPVAVATRARAPFRNRAGAGGGCARGERLAERVANPLNILAFARSEDHGRERRGECSTRSATCPVAQDRGAGLGSPAADRRFVPVVAQAQTGYPRPNYLGGRRHRRGDRPRRDILLHPICCQHSCPRPARRATRRRCGPLLQVEPRTAAPAGAEQFWVARRRCRRQASLGPDRRNPESRQTSKGNVFP